LDNYCIEKPVIEL